MRRIALLIIAIVFLLSSDEIFAQCKQCDEDIYGCKICTPTDYNANILCTISGNGTICLGQGQCEGINGECWGRCRTLHARATEIRPLDDASGALIELRLAESFPTFIETGPEWQLVSVKITRAKARS